MEGAMSNLGLVPIGKDQGFVPFVEYVFGNKSMGFYRNDVSRLLVLLHKMKKDGLPVLLKKMIAEGPFDPELVRRYEPLTMHCEYVWAKLLLDVRAGIDKMPFWLSALAGHEDYRNARPCKQIVVISVLCEQVESLLKRYGPDSHNTIPPPASESDS
ncbi:MAG: hypothetical protein WCW34_04590 [Patescibacteria group bacterium]|jgi:hypothetical protein